MPWRTEHSVEARVSRDRAWRYWTTVTNWTIDPAIEWVKIDGPFACGAIGETKPVDGDPVRWAVVEIDEGERAVIEVRVPGAVARFVWQFEQLAAERTRLTQTVTIEGPAGNAQAEQIGAELEQGIGLGMRMLANAMDRAALPE